MQQLSNAIPELGNTCFSMKEDPAKSSEMKMSIRCVGRLR